MRRLFAVTALLAAVLAGCGDDGDPDAAPEEDSTEQSSSQDAGDITRVELTAKDFSFDVDDSIVGGVVEFDYTNAGAEPHFAGLVKMAPGKTIDDLKNFFGGPPAGPPPFEEIGGLPTTDPGASGNQTLDLEPGDYAFFCAIPSPDGVPHVAKGMVQPLTVTEPDAGADAELPEADVSMTGQDFAYGTLPTFEAGESTVEFKNQGQQLHEINLVELKGDTTVDEFLGWLASPAGPPPGRLLAGAAINPGASTTTRLDLQADKRYAFICAIPDPADGKPHFTKGMKTESFTPQ